MSFTYTHMHTHTRTHTHTYTYIHTQRQDLEQGGLISNLVRACVYTDVDMALMAGTLGEDADNPDLGTCSSVV
jgi:hypothetical protein